MRKRAGTKAVGSFAELEEPSRGALGLLSKHAASLTAKDPHERVIAMWKAFDSMPSDKNTLAYDSAEHRLWRDIYHWGCKVRRSPKSLAKLQEYVTGKMPTLKKRDSKNSFYWVLRALKGGRVGKFPFSDAKLHRVERVLEIAATENIKTIYLDHFIVVMGGVDGVLKRAGGTAPAWVKGLRRSDGQP